MLEGISSLVAVVPVIAKDDTHTAPELEAYRREVLQVSQPGPCPCLPTGQLVVPISAHAATGASAVCVALQWSGSGRVGVWIVPFAWLHYMTLPARCCPPVRPQVIERASNQAAAAAAGGSGAAPASPLSSSAPGLTSTFSTYSFSPDDLAAVQAVDPLMPPFAIMGSQVGAQPVFLFGHS